MMFGVFIREIIALLWPFNPNILLDSLPLYTCCHMGLFTVRIVRNVFGFLTSHYLSLMSGVGVDWNYEQTESLEIRMDF